MNKTEIIGELAARTNITQAQSGEIVNALLDILTEYLEKHEKVSFLGFGIFEAKAYSERVARNPRTKETVTIPAGYKLVFKASRVLREKVNTAG